MIPLFLHLPKTGGTSLSKCICDQYYTLESGSSDDLDPYFQGGLYYFPTGFFEGQHPPYSDEVRTHLKRTDLLAVMGHFTFGLHRNLRKETDFCYLTMLRVPSDRVASLYRHLIQYDVPDSGLHRRLIDEDVSLHEFVSTFDLPELENDQTRRIAGVSGSCTRADLERAKRRLIEEFALVGLTEKFDESLVLLKRMLGWKIPLQYYPMNVSPKLEMPAQKLSVDTLAAINSRNAYDLELYALAEELFEQARSKELDDGLLEEVEEFRQHNRKMNAEWNKTIIGEGSGF